MTHGGDLLRKCRDCDSGGTGELFRAKTRLAPALVGALAWVCAFAAAASAGDLPPGAGEVIRQFQGQLYFAAKSLKTGETIEHRAGEKVQTASVIKVAILVELFAAAHEHRLSLDDVVAFSEENRVPGSGILQDLGVGLHLRLRDAGVLMTVLSDNSATNILIDRLGVAAVNARMRAAGLEETVLFKKVFKPAAEPLPEEQKKWGLGVTTPRDMLRLFEKLYRKEIVDAASCDAMLAILKKQRDRDAIPRYFTGKAWEKVEVAHKTGALDRVRNDTGIVFTPDGDSVLALFAQESEDQRWTADNAATLALAKLAEALVSHFRGPTR